MHANVTQQLRSLSRTRCSSNNSGGCVLLWWLLLAVVAVSGLGSSLVYQIAVTVLLGRVVSLLDRSSNRSTG